MAHGARRPLVGGSGRRLWVAERCTDLAGQSDQLNLEIANLGQDIGVGNCERAGNYNVPLEESSELGTSAKNTCIFVTQTEYADLPNAMTAKTRPRGALTKNTVLTLTRTVNTGTGIATTEYPIQLACLAEDPVALLADACNPVSTGSSVEPEHSALGR